MEFDKIHVDVNEMEKQRYKAIKESGHYLELDVLIGRDKETFGEHTGKMPVVTTTMHGCTDEEISCLYAVLTGLVEHLENEYPIECLMSKIGMSVTKMGSVETPIEIDEKDEEK